MIKLINFITEREVGETEVDPETGIKTTLSAIDPETGKNHLAHALCCLMFLYEHDVKYSVQNKKNVV